jgi:hypothetical protein
MDPASIASALIGSQAGQTQVALSISMEKFNADSQNAMAQMLAASAQSASQPASLPPGVGQRLDVAA